MGGTDPVGDPSATRAQPWVAGLLRGLSIVSLVAAVAFLVFALDPFFGLEDRRVVVERDLVARLALSFGALASPWPCGSAHDSCTDVREISNRANGVGEGI